MSAPACFADAQSEDASTLSTSSADSDSDETALGPAAIAQSEAANSYTILRAGFTFHFCVKPNEKVLLCKKTVRRACDFYASVEAIASVGGSWCSDCWEHVPLTQRDSLLDCQHP